MKVKCENCSKEFNKFPNQIKKSPINYCSRSCAAIVNNKKFPKRVSGKPPSNKVKRTKKEKPITKKRERLCDVDTCACGKSKQKRSKVCQGCIVDKSLSRKKTDVLYLHQLNRASKYCRIREHARIVAKKNNLLTKPCAKCGFADHVEICHIKSISEFLDTDTLGDINSITNLVQLCPNCHWLFDHGKISL